MDIRAKIDFGGNNSTEHSFVEYIKFKTAVNPEKFAKIVELIRKSKETNVQTGVDINGRSLAPLKPSTIKSKMRKGKLLAILYETGQLYNSVKSRMINPSEAEVYISSNRSEVAKHLIFGNKNMSARNFFFGTGINLQQKIEKILTDG